MSKRKTFEIFLFCFFISFASLSWAENKKIVIEIPAQVRVANRELKLSDMAKITGGDQTVIQRIGELRLGIAPVPGGSRTFTYKYLKFLLQTHLAKGLWELKMSEQVRVETLSICITDHDLEEAIKRKLPIAPPEGQIWLELRNLPSKLYLTNSQVELRVEPLTDLKKLGTVLFKVKIVSAGKVVKTLNISGRLRARGVCYQSIRNLTRGTVLQESDFKRVLMELQSGEELVGGLPEGYRLAQNIRFGRILKENQLERIPLVSQGSEVKVIITEAALELQLTAIAQNDGWLGDQIKLLNPMSQKIFSAEVTAPSTVEVNLK